jgi:putative transcription factor
MCGADIKGPVRRIRTEGTELSVCNNCVKFGVEIHAAPKTPSGAAGRISPSHASAVPPARKPRDFFDQMGGELAEDYAERIRTARMKLGMTQKDLALAMMEKELLIKKLEKGELIPEDDVRKKLEKALSISLLESTDMDVQDLHHTRLTTTMGDVIKIKKAKK